MIESLKKKIFKLRNLNSLLLEHILKSKNDQSYDSPDINEDKINKVNTTKTMAKKSVTKKPATRTKIHKDTKSHNVNIRVVSGFSGTIYDAQKLRSEMLDKILKTKNYITEIQNVINEKSPAEKGSLRLTIAIHKRTIENYKKCIKTLDTIIAQNLK